MPDTCDIGVYVTIATEFIAYDVPVLISKDDIKSLRIALCGHVLTGIYPYF